MKCPDVCVGGLKSTHYEGFFITIRLKKHTHFEGIVRTLNTHIMV